MYLPNLRVSHGKYTCLGKNVLTIQLFVYINMNITKLSNSGVLDFFLMFYLARRICKMLSAWTVQIVY